MNNTLPERRWFPRLALSFVLLAVLVYVWQNPALYCAPISSSEAAKYLETLRTRPLPMPLKDEVAKAAETFMKEDDGQPVYMLNLMRFRTSIATVSPPTPFSGTPEEANALYESKAIPLLLKTGGQPFYMSEVKDANLIGDAPSLNNWSRVLLIRYPNRRAFMELITDPAYADIAAYKIMAMEVVLTPTVDGQVIPPLWVLVCVALLILYLVVVATGKRQSINQGDQP